MVVVVLPFLVGLMASSGQAQVPSFSQSQRDNLWNDHSDFVNIINADARHVARTGAQREQAPTPQTLILGKSGALLNVVPQDSGHPLYGDSGLRAEFLNDHFVADRISPDDPRMETTQGLVIQNLNGNNLTFKKELGRITINGVEAEPSSSEGFQIYAIDRPLNHWFDRIQEVWRNTPSQGSPFEGHRGGSPFQG